MREVTGHAQLHVVPETAYIEKFVQTLFFAWNMPHLMSVRHSFRNFFFHQGPVISASVVKTACMQMS